MLIVIIKALSQTVVSACKQNGKYKRLDREPRYNQYDVKYEKSVEINIEAVL